MSLIIPANTLASGGGYAVDNSCRFNDGSSDNLSKTYGANATNGNKFTFSCWVKRGVLGTRQQIFSCYDGGAGGQDLEFEATTDVLSYNDGGAGDNDTSMVFRDTSAWYHIVLAQDTTQGSAATQVKIYVNGVQQSLGVNSGASAVSQFGKNGLTARIGSNHDNSTHYFDGYLAETIFIDGLQLGADSFGEFDEDSGIWKPKSVSGLTFGTNGFYLDFEDSGALGADVSGNTNNFTVNNLTAIDQTTDTPTNNFATLNSLSKNGASTNYTLSDGNLTYASSETSSSYSWFYSTIGVSSGKWYAEFKVTDSDGIMLGVGGDDGETSSYFTASGRNGIGIYWNGIVYVEDVSQGSLTEIADNDIISIAMDLDNNLVYWYHNGTIQNSGTGMTIPTSNTGFYHFVVADSKSTGTPTAQSNFGNPTFTGTDQSDGNSRGSFEYAPPSGYLSLCTANLSEVLG